MKYHSCAATLSLLIQAASGATWSARPRTDAASLGLLRWASGAGVRTAPGFVLGRFTASGNDAKALDGVLAGMEVPAGTEIVRLPRKQTLQSRAVGDVVPAGVSRDEWERGPWFGRLALRLLAEVEAGNAGSLAPYVDALPRCFDTPLHWSDEELSELQNERMACAVAEQRLAYGRLLEWAKPMAPVSHEGCSGMQWDVVGCSGMAVGCSGM